MRCPARLVTGTAAAALTAAALGLAAPSAHAAGPGRLELAAVSAAPGAADCGADDAAAPGTAACDSGDAALAGPEAPVDPATAPDPEPAGDPAAGDPSAEDPSAEELEPLDGLEPAEDLAAVSAPAWPETDEAGTGDEAATLQPPGAGTASGNRPEPLTPPGTADPGSARPPVPPGHRPTTAPSPSRPSGHVGTGVGGSTAPDTAQLAAGAALVGAAAFCGVLLLRRRRTGGLYR
ncbi:hypothetical protein [Streptomyces sp. NPDC059446]|uniref:hypothetical protein n=1 Tax=Streptomyces sp. NPDC059446 TaxID=3346833 RepID=UPI0036C288EA